jgi:hypothetical protein
MCVTFCHRKRILFWNHDSCLCSVADEEDYESCQTCLHRRGKICALTNEAILKSGGCCHCGVQMVAGVVQVTPAMAAPLVGFFDAVKNVMPKDIPYQTVNRDWQVSAEYTPKLDELGIPFQVNGQSGVVVNPECLILAIDEPVPDILDSLDAAYQLVKGVCWIDPDQLGLPEVFGRAVEY